jgi:L-threonylcarbamoyladenylate synthase
MTFKHHQFETGISIDEAIFFLKSGYPVAIPTETVYGLAAPIDSKIGLERIFKIKSRPFFDPLIVHVASENQARSLCSYWPKIAHELAVTFWPGPLTLVLEKSPKVDDLITSGLSTVGLRMPNHPIALKLIQECGALAAPSANKFGRTSPTKATHLIKEYEGTLPVVDGGACQIGIESTILKISSEGKELSILRPGVILQSQIDQHLKKKGYQYNWVTATQDISPGSMKHHYMPSTPLIVTTKLFPDRKIIEVYYKNLSRLPDQIEGVTLTKPKKIQNLFHLTLPDSPELVARQLYSSLRSVPPNSDLIVLHWPLGRREGIWYPIWDRLSKAATLTI